MRLASLVADGPPPASALWARLAGELAFTDVLDQRHSEGAVLEALPSVPRRLQPRGSRDFPQGLDLTRAHRGGENTLLIRLH